MNQIDSIRKLCVLLLGIFAAVLSFSTTKALIGVSHDSGLQAQIDRQLAARPKPAAKPVIRLLRMHNLSNPQIPLVFVTMILEPDKKTIKIFICQENATPMPAWQGFEGICGKGDQPRSILSVMNMPAVTDGSDAGNEKAMNEVKLEFATLPEGKWEFKPMPGEQSQVEAFAGMMNAFDQRDYVAKLSSLTEGYRQAKSSITTQTWIGLGSLIALGLIFGWLRQQYSLFCQSALVLAFAGELEPSADTDVLMPGFLNFVRVSTIDLARDTLEKLLESRRRLYRRQNTKQNKGTETQASGSGSVPIAGAKLELAQRLRQTERQYHLLRELVDGNTPLGRQSRELYVMSQWVKENDGDLRESLKLLHQAIRLFEKSLGSSTEAAGEIAELARTTSTAAKTAAKKPPPIDRSRELPKTFQWPNDSGRIEYEQHFFDAFWGLTAEEQRRVIDQLHTLATQGPEYPSLHTRKPEMRLPHSPLGCLVSRGAQELRFTWAKNATIVVCWLYRKGDSRVRQNSA